MDSITTFGGSGLERTPQRIGAEIRALTYQAKCMTVYYGVEIGRRLTEVKQMVGHGNWGEWIKSETEFSQATATRFMKVYEVYAADQIGIFGAEAKSSTLQNLSISNALRLLAVPEDERESFATEVDAEHISARELEQAIRERDEAKRAAAEAQASEKATAEDNQKLADNIRELKQLQCTAEFAEENARRELDRIRAELKALREKPVEVAVEVRDAAPEQIAKAAEETRHAVEAEWQERLSQAENRLSAAAEDKKALEEKIKVLTQKASDAGNAAKEENARLSGEIERLKKQLTMTDTGLATFKAKLEGMSSAFADVENALAKLAPDVRKKMIAAVRAQFGAWEKSLNDTI